MSLLFSQVTLTADNNAETEFLVGGIPRDTDDLEGWTGYENFVDEVDKIAEINAHIETYLYGEGEAVKASPEEIAYLTKRIENDPDFLSGHTDNIEDSDFRIRCSPFELSGTDFLEL